MMQFSPNRETITAVFIAKNEEHQIERALKSVSSWVDEIVVVDGESTDKTREIAKKYTDKVVVHPFSGSFSDDRRLGEETATSQWVLQMDADEEVTANFKETVLTLLAKDSKKYDGFKFFRRNWFLGQRMEWGGWGHYIPFLYRKNKARFHTKVHENVTVDGPQGIIKAEINHYPFQSLSQFMTRHNRYSTLKVVDIYEREGIVPLKKLKYHLAFRPLKLFWKMYVKKKGYRDGMHGLIFAILFSFQHFLEWAKYWEKYRDQLSQR